MLKQKYSHGHKRSVYLMKATVYEYQTQETTYNVTYRAPLTQGSKCSLYQAMQVRNKFVFNLLPE